MSDALVPLCHCSGITEAQAIRASLEARGIFTHVDGEHQRSILGMFGTVVALRIMVPRSRLRVAYQLALEIIPDLPAPDFDDEDSEASLPEPPPLRRALPEDLVPYPDDIDGDAEAEDAHAEEEEDDDDDDSFVDVREQARRAERALSQLRDEAEDLVELGPPPSLFVPRVAFAAGLGLAVTVSVAGYLGYGLIVAALMLLLVYVRVLPLTEPRDS